MSLLAALPATAAPRTLVLVSIDGLPRDAAWRHVAMPELDALARAGEAGMAEPPASTLPFVNACVLLSGSPAARTGVRDESSQGLAAAAPTLASALGAARYHALALPADPLSHAASGLARGFERFLPESPALEDSARVDSALAWLAQPGRRFVWLAFTFGAPSQLWRRGDGIGPEDPTLLRARARTLDRALARLAAGRADGVVIAGTSPARVDAASGAFTPALVLMGAAAPPAPRRGFAADARLEDVAATLLRMATGAPGPFAGRDLRVAPGTARTRHAGARASDPDRDGRLAARALASVARPDSVTLTALDSLVAAHPTSLATALERADALSRAGREADAGRRFKEWLAAHPERHEVALAYADHLLRYHRDELVSEPLLAIDRGNPLAALAGWRIALARTGLLDFAAARTSCERASALLVPNASALALPAALAELQRLDDGVKAHADDAAQRLAFAQALGDLGLVDAAFEQLHAARGLLPKSAEPDYRLGLLLLQAGRPQHAIPTLERALATDSTHHGTRLALADALMQHGERARARHELERAAATGPLEPRDRYNLACLLATDGDKAAALTALERAFADGYDGWAQLDTDPDLASLRGEPRFASLKTRRPAADP